MRQLDCTTCRFSEVMEDDDDHIRCRRYPPGGDYKERPGKTEKKRLFPIMDKTLWCGEHHYKYESDLEL